MGASRTYYRTRRLPDFVVKGANSSAIDTSSAVASTSRCAPLGAGTSPPNKGRASD